MELTCINCPVGCRVTVKVEGGEVTEITGNSCKLGERYARQEAVKPLRMVTAVVPVEGGETPLSVKTAAPIPKESIQRAMEELSRLRLKAPVQLGDVVLQNVGDSGVDVIATKTVKKQ